MALRAVIFDYGKVLSALPDADSHSRLVAATGLDDAVFEDHYWAHRHDYDSGTLTGHSYWNKIADGAGFVMTDSLMEELIAQDCRMWGSLNEAMVTWAAKLLRSGLRVAVLSNMGDAIRDRLLKQNPWLRDFDQLTWSSELRMAKPDVAIYQYTLEKLGVRPAECLFIDDVQHNVEAATTLGIEAIQFQDVRQLRTELIKRNLDKILPLPEME